MSYIIQLEPLSNTFKYTIVLLLHTDNYYSLINSDKQENILYIHLPFELSLTSSDVTYYYNL